MVPQPAQKDTIPHERNYNRLVLQAEQRSTHCRLVHVRLKPQGPKDKSNCSNSCQFIWNCAKNCVDCLEVPFWYNMCGCGVGICRDVVIRMSLKFRLKVYLVSSPLPLNHSSYLVLGVVVGVEIHQISLSVNSQGVGGSILVQSCKVNQGQSSQQEGEQVMQTIKTILCWIIHTKSSPQPSYNTSTYYRLSTCQACNNGPPPKRHLSPRQYVTNKGGQNHNQQDDYSHLPNEFTRLSITSVIQATEKMHVNYSEKQTSTVCMQIALLPPVGHVTHQVLNTVKGQINVSSIMHCQENSSPNLQD